MDFSASVILMARDVTNVYCKLVGLCLNYLSWALGIGLAHSRSWRVWEFNSNAVRIMFIGLWEAFYVQNVNISGLVVELPMYTNVNGSWVIPDEISYGRELLLLDNLMKSVTLYFSSLAFFVTWTNGPYIEFLQSCYSISASFLYFSSVCTLITVCWNFYVDFYGRNTLEFPVNFPVQREMTNKKHISYVLPLGVITSILSLTSAIIFSFDTCSFKQWAQVEPMVVDQE
ncbi:hypothetical protein mRhiFer1_007973 [Rhinolophus ferrumequinum]|uniref:Uncharacterized protein n=1 Tax=Rhinolophus ferrumequinum TaxID=59479 RepID=A0A7J8AUZ8_RHIFE|nr:hypothetical protein mRhiFer1_007973 [Rhinolophus ferrumequinum]